VNDPARPGEPPPVAAPPSGSTRQTSLSLLEGIRNNDAGAWRRERQSKALADFDELRNEIRSAASFTQPALRDRCLRTAQALAMRNRWSDLAQLTDALSARDERVPLDLIVMRGAALLRLERLDAMRQLVVDLLHNPTVKRKKDPEVMMEIAELLADMDELGGAIRLLERVRATDSEMPGVQFRIEQLALEQRLASAYALLKTEHFDVRYPTELPPANAQKIANVLESEFKRLRAAWFPNRQFHRIGVELLSWEDFRNYTGSEYIAGLFTNKIYLPLAGIDVFPPEIVAIMTHELTHALLADASNNLAPRWFHEAFASRMEMKDTPRNAFHMYKDERFLALALLDAVANGSNDAELVIEAYRIGETTVRFIEARYGKAGLLKMIDAFRRGADTEEAVHALTGGSLADLDRNARAWGLAQAPFLPGSPIVRYDIETVPR